jgi:CheY-like chemotaxis protein
VKILIIDDNDDTRAVARMSFEILGRAEVAEAASGSDGVMEAARAQPDLILLDMEMPGMDGLATLSQLRADHATRSIPVIFFASEANSPSAEEWKASGVIGVVTKPFDPSQLPLQVLRVAKPHLAAKDGSS